jgi:hypothetical protein
LQKTASHFTLVPFDSFVIFTKNLCLFMKQTLVILFVVLLIFIPGMYGEEENLDQLFKDLQEVALINQNLQEDLPLFYNFSVLGGYFNMPSARMNKEGTIAAGACTAYPYSIYGVNMQPFDRIELSANYLIYNGVMEPGFGSEGFGDDAERMGNIKIGILTPTEDLPYFPLISVGAQDFIGTKRFNAQYVVATKLWKKAHLECSLGWGHGRIKGFFGGATWAPFYKKDVFYKTLSLQLEYDANDYKKSPGEHPKARTVKSRLNGGVSVTLFDALQCSVSSVRGEKIAASATLSYPLGTSQGFFPKVQDPKMYSSPVDTEPLGVTRSETEFIRELTFAFSDQGLDLYKAYLLAKEGKKELWLKIVNNRYRASDQVRERIQNVLASLIPSNIDTVTVVIEDVALPCLLYQFRVEDLYRYRLGIIGAFEMQILSPAKEVTKEPSDYESILLFHRTKPIWTFTARPRLISFFGNVNGKFKCNLSVTASPEGYLFDEIYYKTLLSYSVISNTKGMTGVDRLNPSHMFVVRSDSMRYHQTSTIHLEQAFLQKSWNLGKSFFYRLAGGYFEVAYAGVATELLWYPIQSPFAVGIEEATVWKRHYTGLKFFHHVQKFDGTKTLYLPFTGVQCFLNLYYFYRPLSMDFKITAGRFLAKDLGARFEVGKSFASGMRFSLWYSLTNANEELNGHRYHDKGFSFVVPLDMFMKQSSRSYVGYAMSAWLRDQAAEASTGKPLYPTLFESRALR